MLYESEIVAMIDDRYPLSELTAKIIGCAMEVHRILGTGFQEVVYQRALAVELELQGVNFVREKEMQIYYKERRVGSRRVDFFIEGQLSTEIKAQSTLDNVHLAQAINYLEAYKLNIGLLINFGSPSLQFKRVMKPRSKWNS